MDLRSILEAFAQGALGYAVMGFLLFLLLIGIDENVRRLMFRVLSVLTIALFLVVIYVNVDRTIEARITSGQTILPDQQTLIPTLLTAAVVILLMIGMGMLVYAAKKYRPDLFLLPQKALQQYIRRVYLEKMQALFKPQIAHVVPLPIEVNLDTLALHNTQILGDPGMGKSTLLRCIFVALAQKARRDPTAPLPVFIDIDHMLRENIPLEEMFLQTISFNWFQQLMAEWLLKFESQQGSGVCFVGDSSALSHPSMLAPLSTESTWPEELIRLGYIYRKRSIILASPLPVLSVSSDIKLSSLRNEEIQGLLNSVKGLDGAALYQALASEASWLHLARRPMILFQLVRYYQSHQALPVDFPTLIQDTSYPKILPVEVTETVLTSLAFHVLDSNSYQVPLAKVYESVQDKLTKTSFQTAIRRLSSAEIVAYGKKTRGNPETVSFGHPLLLSYFIALGWREGKLSDPILKEVIGFADQPILADAFTFFSHIDPDRTRFIDLMFKLVNRRDRSWLALAANCILSRSEESWPTELLEKITPILIEQLVASNDLSEHALLYLDTWEQAKRVQVYTEAFALMEPDRTHQTLSWLAENRAEDFQSILLLSDEPWNQETASILVNDFPENAASILEYVYCSSPNLARRAFAIDFLGFLPREYAENLLRRMLEEELEPELRVEILKSLVRTGSESILTLLDLVTSPHESDAVRSCAAELLANSKSREIYTDQAISQVVRAAYMKLPEEISAHLLVLRNRMEEIKPELIKELEKNINPYTAGRPVLDKSMFIGRDALLSDLRGKIGSNMNVILHGERRIGKTSILYQLLHQLEDESERGIFTGLPIYINLEKLRRGDQGVEPVEELFTFLVCSIAEKTPNLKIADVPGTYTYDQFHKDFRFIIDDMMETQGNSSKLVLLMDEADALNAYPDAVLSLLRRTFNHEDIIKNLVVFLAGVDPVRNVKSPTSPFYNIFKPVEIPPLSPEAAVELIIEPVAGRLTYTDMAIDLILQYSRYRPYEIQNICQQVVNKALALGSQHITPILVEETCGDEYKPQMAMAMEAYKHLESLLDWLKKEGKVSSKQLDKRLQEMMKSIQKAIETHTTVGKEIF